MNKKGFTLIELLIVVAIIGILAAVGAVVIPNVLDKTKKTATIKQHQTIKDYILQSWIRCDIAAFDGTHTTMGGYILWKSSPPTPVQNYTKMYCQGNGRSAEQKMAKHFCFSGYKNLWDSSKFCGVNKENNIGPHLKPALGQTLISCLNQSNPKECTIATQVIDGEIIVDYLKYE